MRSRFNAKSEIKDPLPIVRVLSLSWCIPGQLFVHFGRLVLTRLFPLAWSSNQNNNPCLLSSNPTPWTFLKFTIYLKPSTLHTEDFQVAQAQTTSLHRTSSIMVDNDYTKVQSPRPPSASATAPKGVGAGNTNTKTRKRARRACYSCHMRKVRCDVVVAGSPCTNCKLDTEKCIIRPNRRRWYRVSNPA